MKCRHCSERVSRKDLGQHEISCFSNPDNKRRVKPEKVVPPDTTTWKFETYIPPTEGKDLTMWLESRVNDLQNKVFDLTAKVTESDKLTDLLYNDFQHIYGDINPFVRVNCDMWKERLEKAANDLKEMEARLQRHVIRFGNSGQLF